MAVTQQVIWTLLPQGFADASTLAFTVLVSPRLASSAAAPTIHDFPDWLDWPRTLSTARFRLVIDGAPGAPITPLPKADSSTWKRMVAPSTQVDPYKFRDLSKAQLLSYPVARLAALIEGVYGPIGARSPTSLPTKDMLAPTARKLAGALGSRNDVFGSFKNGFINADSYGSDVGAMRLLTAYHTPLNQLQPQPNPYKPDDPRHSLKVTTYRQTARPTPAQLASSIDFHKIVTSAIEHQDLALSMGLVLIFQVPAALVPDGSHSLSLSVDRGLTPSPDLHPQTQIIKKAPTFEAQIKSPGGPLVSRYLSLQAQGGFDLIQLDVDGGALKLKNLMQAVPTLPTSGYDDQDFAQPQQAAGLPSLRTAGLMLAQAQRFLDAESRFDASAKLQQAVEQNTPLPTLWAEDLVRGYRVDVLDKADGTWRSLMARQVSFTFTADATKRVSTEEGMMRFSGGGSTDGANADVLKIHEGVFVWRGWSLATPEPFQALAVDPGAVPGHDPQGDPTPAGLPLNTVYLPVKGSLPRLRFGHSYQVRVRTVDLSGFSLATGDAAAPAQAASNALVYRRYEPVEPPALVLPAPGGTPIPVAEGESMGRAVVRTYNDTPAKNTIVNSDQAVRLIAAPRVSVRFAEAHGVLDTAAGRLDPGAYAMLAAKDKDFAVDPPNPPVTTPPTPTPTPQHAIADPAAPLPYLPDPFASAVAITVSGLTGVDPTQVYTVPFYPDASTTWPNAAPFLIVGSETITSVGFDAAKRQFTVPLKKGERAVLKLSCVIPEKRIGDMAMAALISAQPKVNLQQIGQIILSGQHWMLTPWTTLELVHAVQQPLVTPDLTQVNAVRKGGLYSHDAVLIGTMPVSAHSTTKVDLEARWSEPDDEPQDAAAATAPAVVGSRVHAAELNLSRNAAPNGLLRFDNGMEHHYPDTRYRRVFYSMSATSRYREFMPPSVLNQDGFTTVTSAEVRRWIANTAPPPAPRPLYVIPTFGWSRSANGGQSVSVRSGGGLRVYLDRPLFTTGFGEMLAVVLPAAGTSTADADTLLKTHITQWGRDPIWSSAAVNTIAPDPSAFPLAKWAGPIGFEASGATNSVPADVVAAFEAEHADLPPGNFTVTGLTPPGLPSGKSVAIAPHAVGFDADRQLWYCDIVIRPPTQAYYPFVRLALACYQPTSASGAHLSATVVTEFQQLAADRMAVVTQTGAAFSQASVSIYGFAPQDPLGGGAGAAVFRAKTQVLDAGADPDLDWRDEAGNAPPVFKGARGALQAKATSSTRLGAQFELPAPVQEAFVSGKLGAIATGGLQNLLAPALLWTWQGYLPATPSGGRRRVLITESESYATGEATTAAQPRGERIVFAEAIEV